MRHPANVTRRAGRELIAILERSQRQFGAEHADRLEATISQKCRDIDDGLDHGHARFDVVFKAPTRFVTVGIIMIAYNPVTRRVVRIFDGRRDFSGLFG